MEKLEPGVWRGTEPPRGRTAARFTVDRFDEMRTRHAREHDGPGHSGHLRTLHSGRRGAIQQRSRSGQSGHDAIFAARYGALSTVSWRIYNQVDVLPYFPMDISNSYQPVTTGYAINSLGKAKWSLSCAHSLNTYMHVLSPATVPLDQACS